jgi:arylsulfatase A-like enzyme
MVVNTEGFKYIRYDVAEIEENLLDLNKDPFEMTHFTEDPDYADKLNELKSVFDQVGSPEEIEFSTLNSFS